jgi:hypothetical protein
MADTTTATATGSALAKTLPQLLEDPQIALAAVQAHLRALDGPSRIRECRMLGRRHQILLHRIAAEGEPVTPDDMVTGVSDGEPVIWYGRNSLPAFRIFEKRFRRHEGEIVGYNHNSPLVTWFGGPGYYVCRADDQAPKEIVVDYTRVPATTPPGWPRVKKNTSGFSYLVYANMQDHCRRVSETVVIGAAVRSGRSLGQYFVLCRG